MIDTTPEQLRERANRLMESAQRCDDYTRHLYDINIARDLLKQAEELEKEMKIEKSAKQLDAEWLIKNGYSKVNADVFCSMVTRKWNDLLDRDIKPNTDEIREDIIKEMGV